MQRADTPERLDRYVARLSATPAFYDATIDVMRDGVAARVTSPRIVVERAVAQVERLLATPLEQSPGLVPVPPGGRARSCPRDRSAREPLPALARRAISRPCASTSRRRPKPSACSPCPAATTSTRRRSSRGPRSRSSLERSTTSASRTSSGSRKSARLCAERIGAADPAAAEALLDERGNRAGSKERARGARRGAGRQGVGGGAGVVRAHAVGELRGEAGRGVPRGRHALRLLPAAVGRRLAQGRLLRERRRPRGQAAASPGDHHLPRGEPRPSLPDRARAGDGRAARAATVRRAHGRVGLRRGLGPVQRAPRGRDGTVRRRVRASRDARHAGNARGPAGRRHRDPRVRLVARAGHRARSRTPASPTSTP